MGLAAVAAAVGDNPATVAAHYADAITPDKRRVAEKPGKLLQQALEFGEKWKREHAS